MSLVPFPFHIPSPFSAMIHVQVWGGRACGFDRPVASPPSPFSVAPDWWQRSSFGSGGGGLVALMGLMPLPPSLLC